MDAKGTGRLAGIGGFAVGAALAALVLAAPGAAATDCGRAVAGEEGRAAYGARLDGGAEALFATVSGVEWASTRQFPGRPH